MNINIDSETNMPTINDMGYLKNLGANYTVIIVLILIILSYFLIFSTLGSGGKIESIETTVVETDFLGIFLVCLFIVLLAINGTQYYYNIDIVARVKNLFTKTPEIDIEIQKEAGEVPAIINNNQVFHVSKNDYTYNDAGAICKAYGSRLATYKEVEDAYNNGADWCSYGWSQNQLALYPTQQSKWDELQKIEGHKNDCGRPGINGGFIDNQNVKFGVNCYGYKPKINNLETQLMNNTSIYPKTKKELDLENKVKYWKTRINDILVAPFNNSKWDA